VGHRQAFVNMVMNIPIISKVGKYLGDLCGSLLVKKELSPTRLAKKKII
jgi:hypothetical protein